MTSHQANQLLIDVLDPFGPEFDRHGVVCDFQSVDPRISLTTNREIAQQALANLLQNAIWFASQGDASTHTVIIGATEDGFFVEDNGPGIDEAHVDNIWEPHFTRREGAHGMGLTLVRTS